MPKVYKKLLFDLDNTLVDDDENREYAIKEILIQRNEVITVEKVENFIKLDNQFWKDRAAGKIKDPYEFKTKEEKTEWIRAQRFIRYFKNISFEEAVKINNIYMDYLKNHIVPIKNAEEILNYLYEKQYEIYIITNGPTIAVNDKLCKANIKKYVQGIFSAEEAGSMKPHHDFFKCFFKKINCDNKEEMLIIGDELEKDILGGIQNDIDTCWFNMNKIQNYTQLKPTYEINDLIELKGIL